MWSLEPIAPEPGLALTLEQARAHSRLLASLPAEHDQDLELKIRAAIQQCELYTGRQLITRTWQLWLSSWCEEGIYLRGTRTLLLPRPPVIELDQIVYIDPDGTEITMDSDDYEIAGNSGAYAQRAELFPAYGKVWPAVRSQPGAIKITYSSGYGTTAAAVPESLRQGMLLRVAESYERREEQTLGAVVSSNLITADRLWDQFRVEPF